ncbi:MAG: NapC/NirT family cytochrome c [Thermodesulfovibrionales bacterium]|nr:NapC/NirT family cytochrome c [Thermodesulfovibrionales bacterium]
MGKLIKIQQKIKNFVKNNLKLTIFIIFVLIAIYTFISVEALHYTSSPKFCKNCHPENRAGLLGEVYTWQMTAHAKAGVECLDCHGKIGFFGYMKAKMGGLRDVYGEFFKTPEYKLEILRRSTEDTKYAAKLVPSETCLFCHSDSYNQKIRKERLMKIVFTMRMVDNVKNPEFRHSKGLTDILTEGLRQGASIDPKHSKHQEKGINCVDCHLGVVHGGQPVNKTKMQTCFDCHDKISPSKAPANENCKACHLTEESMIPKTPILFGRGASAVKFSHDTHASLVSCKDCHNKLFQMKKGSTKFTYDDHIKGRLCFDCHNGKKAFSWSSCKNCHDEIPAPKTSIVYKPKGIGQVEFSHDFHTSAFSCNDCHDKIWQMKKFSKRMTMDEMYKGKYCGKCHDGKSAFSSSDCDKCHK